MGKLKAAVIGLGMGKAHIKGYQSHPNVEVVAIADLNEELCIKVQKEFSIPSYYTNPEVMLEKEEIDIISIATPNKFHMPLTLAAFKAGCHVLCEKPMAMNAGEGQQMIEAAEKAGKRLMINFSYRFHAQSQMLRKEVERGTFGDFYYGRTFWHRRYGMPGFGGWFGNKDLAGGGPLIDLGVHRLDLALWLMDYPEPEVVMGSTYSPIASEAAKKEGKEFTVEDLASGMIKFKNGASLVVEASWAGHIKDKEYMRTQLWGTKAGLVQKNTNGGYSFDAEIYLERDGNQFDLHLSNSLEESSCAMSHFASAILEDTPHIATGKEGLIVMKILDSLYESAATGKPVYPR
jgi:predicted dehydrogenase